MLTAAGLYRCSVRLGEKQCLIVPGEGRTAADPILHRHHLIHLAVLIAVEVTALHGNIIFPVHQHMSDTMMMETLTIYTAPAGVLINPQANGGSFLYCFIYRFLSAYSQ